MRNIITAIALVVAMPAVAGGDLQASCAPIEQEVGGCDCAVGYLRQEIGPDDAEIMLKMWVAASGRGGPDPFWALHQQHGSATLFRATLRFLEVRDTFISRCRPSGETILLDGFNRNVVPEPASTARIGQAGR